MQSANQVKGACASLDDKTQIRLGRDKLNVRSRYGRNGAQRDSSDAVMEDCRGKTEGSRLCR